MVADLAADLLKPHSLEDLDTVLRSATRRVIDQDAFTFAVYNANDHSLEFMAGWDGDVFEGGAVLPVAGTPSENVIRERRSLLTTSSTDPSASGAHIFGTGLRSESAIRSPVVSGDDVVAVISVQSYRPNRYTAEDVEVLEAIASLTATAMRNIRNVEEQQAMQAALRESEERFRQLVYNVRGVFWLKDLRTGRLLYVSPTYELVWGRPLAEVEEWMDSVHPDDRPLVEAALPAQRYGTYDVQFRITRPDGGIRWIRDRAFTVADAGEGHERIAGIAEDITEDLQQQEQLRRAERLAAMGTMVGGVAHELNNPLQSIAGFAEMMLREERSGADREALELIRREAARATRIVAELRLLARRSHDAPAQRERVDLNDVARHVLRIREYSLSTANIELWQELSPALPPVLGDVSQLEQVVMNLVINAAQALADVDGPRRLVVRTHARGDCCVMSVHDNGAGIPREHLHQLFDPFFTTKPPGEGTGLGLPLAQKIVAEHGGAIHVESTPGAGTTFEIELPAAHVDEAAHTAAASQADDRSVAGDTGERRRLRVLVVDDEEAIRKLLRRAVERRGHTADVAGEGGEALGMIEAAAARGETYDLIFSDLRMPGMSGAELARELGRHGRGSLDRLVLMTGDIGSDDIASLATTSSVPLLNKPFSIAEVEALLEARERS